MKPQDQATSIDDLDDLLAADLPELDDLDALLAESMEQVAGRNAAQIAKKRLSTEQGKLPDAERERLLEQVRIWEDSEVWKTEAQVALMERRTCVCCGSINEGFVQLVGRQAHRKEPNTVRFAAPEVLSLTERQRLPNLPRERIFRKVMVAICPLCMGEAWDNTPTTIWEGH